MVLRALSSTGVTIAFSVASVVFIRNELEVIWGRPVRRDWEFGLFSRVIYYLVDKTFLERTNDCFM